MLASSASAAPLAWACGERDHVLGVRRGLEPGRRRSARCAATARWPPPPSAPRRLIGATATTSVGAAVAAVGAERADAAGVGDAQPQRRGSRRSRGARRRRRAARASRSGVGQPEARGPSAAAGPGAGSARTGAPSTTLVVSNTPSPTVSPWSNDRDRAPRPPRRLPLTHDLHVTVLPPVSWGAVASATAATRAAGPP